MGRRESGGFILIPIIGDHSRLGNSGNGVKTPMLRERRIGFLTPQGGKNEDLRIIGGASIWRLIWRD